MKPVSFNNLIPADYPEVNLHFMLPFYILGFQNHYGIETVANVHCVNTHPVDMLVDKFKKFIHEINTKR